MTNRYVEGQTTPGDPRRPLTNREMLFVDAYIIDMNGVAAAMFAGWSERCAPETASRLLTRPNIRAEIGRRMSIIAEVCDTASAKVIKELGVLAFANMGDYLEDNGKGDPAFKKWGDLSREQMAAVSEITIETYTEGKGEDAQPVKRVRFKLHDKKGSLELLGKYLQLWEKQRDADSTPDAKFDRGVSAAGRLAARTVARRAALNNAGSGAERPVLPPNGSSPSE